MTTEQRASFRCPNIDDAQKAVIRVGQREVVVALANQSAGGFSVTAQGNLRVSEGEVLDVRTPAGWFQARVIHRQKRAGQTTLGLVRLTDLPDPRDAQLVRRGGRKFEPTESGSTKSSTLLLIMMVVGLGFWGFLVNFAWFRGPDVAGKPVDLGAYLSRVIDQVTSTAKEARPNDTNAATPHSTFE